MSGTNTNLRISKRVIARLVTARTKNDWLTRRDLLKIGISEAYIDVLLRRLSDRGWLERDGRPGKYKYRASETCHALHQEGQLPRTGPNPVVAVDVNLHPLDEFADVQRAWMEHVRVTATLDKYTADLLRAKCARPRKQDRAQQQSFSCESFTVTVSRKNVVVIILKELDWSQKLPEWLKVCGLSGNARANVLGQISAQIPDAFRRIEIPVLQREVRRRGVRFIVRTRAGDDFVESNINYSTDVDLESLGTGALVDNWMATLAATQHNSVAVLRALQDQIGELVKKAEELRKEQEKKQQAEHEKEADYYG